MPTVWINRETTKLRIASRTLIAESSDAPKVTIPIRDIDRIVITVGSWSLTSRTLQSLMRDNIPIVFLSTTGQPIGITLPPPNTHGHSRLSQYQRTLEADFSLHIAQRLITAKMYNQRRVLQRISAGRTEQSDISLAALRLHTTMISVQKAPSIASVMGYEGTATAYYYNAWSEFLPAAFPFERRSRRPPLNAVNSVISYTSSVLYNEMVAAIFSSGLDPALGMLHTTENGRYSLALDLLEPYRPVLVESLTLDLFSRSMLKEQHFENRDGGVYLNADGRRILFLQYERRMERQFMAEHYGHRITLRQSLCQEAVHFKKALSEPESYHPFRMN